MASTTGEGNGEQLVSAGSVNLRTETPQLISPPDTKTPPTDAQLHIHDIRQQARVSSSQSIDPAALSRALHKFERPREHTPAQSPSRKRQRTQGDRFMPSRAGVDLQSSFNLLPDEASPATPSNRSQHASYGELNFQRVDEANRTYENLLRTELFDDSISRSLNGTPSTPRRKNLFNFSTRSGHPTPHSLPRSQRGPNMNPHSDLYSLSPIKFSSQKMLLTPRKQPRAVSKVPYKVLDAPDLADDFYLNLVDWGSQDVLGVGLGSCVYTWSALSGRVIKLCELQDDTVTSVNWIQRVSFLWYFYLL
jgi:cell division cycle 20-like protein 1, cofactor of APC complex